jgi:hypothetical protein
VNQQTGVVMRLHRLLGLGVAEVIRRVAEGVPLLDRGLFLNDRIPLAALLRDVLAAIENSAHEVHIVLPGEAPDATTLVPEQVLWNLIARDVEPAPIVRPIPDAAVAAVVAAATRAALATLPPAIADELRLVALVTTGEALRPYLALTVRGEGEWDLADSDYAVFADEHLATVADAWDRRGNVWELDEVAMAVEIAVRLATLEEALRLLDAEGCFGTGIARRERLLLVATMPPDETDAGFARRLNPAGPLLERWLDEAAEAPPIRPAPTSGDDGALAGATAPVPALAALWRISCGVLLDDGTHIYAPDEIGERNETFEVLEYAPGWVLVGDDSGGGGYLMRAAGSEFDPADGRLAAEVYRLGLGALTEDVADAGEFVTDDLIGWLAARQR